MRSSTRRANWAVDGDRRSGQKACSRAASATKPTAKAVSVSGRPSVSSSQSAAKPASRMTEADAAPSVQARSSDRHAHRRLTSARKARSSVGPWVIFSSSLPAGACRWMHILRRIVQANPRKIRCHRCGAVLAPATRCHGMCVVTLPFGQRRLPPQGRPTSAPARFATVAADPPLRARPCGPPLSGPRGDARSPAANSSTVVRAGFDSLISTLTDTGRAWPASPAARMWTPGTGGTSPGTSGSVKAVAVSRPCVR